MKKRPIVDLQQLTDEQAYRNSQAKNLLLTQLIALLAVIRRPKFASRGRPTYIRMPTFIYFALNFIHSETVANY